MGSDAVFVQGTFPSFKDGCSASASPSAASRSPLLYSELFMRRPLNQPKCGRVIHEGYFLLLLRKNLKGNRSPIVGSWDNISSGFDAL